jgi:hypothetical protein
MAKFDVMVDLNTGDGFQLMEVEGKSRKVIQDSLYKLYPGAIVQSMKRRS